MTTGIDRTALRKYAHAATPGPWNLGPSEVSRGAWRIGGVSSVIRATWDDAVHIAALDPTTVLALLDRVEAADATIARIEALAREWVESGGSHDCSGQHILDAIAGKEVDW